MIARRCIVLTFMLYLSFTAYIFAQFEGTKASEIKQLFKRYYEKSAARDFTGAIEECKRVMQSHENDPDVQIYGEFNLGGSYLSVAPQEAIKHFLACMRLASQSKEKGMQYFILSSKMGIGKSYMRLKEYEKAREAFSEIVENYRYEDLDEEGQKIYTFATGNIIRCLANEGKETKDIEEYCEKIIARHPNDEVGATALCALREYYRGHKKDRDMAIKLTRRLASEFPDTLAGKRAEIDLAMYRGELKSPQSFREDELPEGFTRGLLMFDFVGKREWEDVRIAGYIRQRAYRHPGYYAVAAGIALDREALTYEPMVVSSSGLSPKVRLLGHDPVTGIAVMHIRGELLPVVLLSRTELSEGDIVTLVTPAGYSKEGKPEFWSADCIVSDPHVRTILPGAPIPAPRLVKIKGVDTILYFCRGGVALNSDGAVVGFCVKWIDEENAALILPETWMRKIVWSLARSGKYSWPYTGARFKDVRVPVKEKGKAPERKIIVEWIDPSGPAKDVLRVGDNIIALDGVGVSDSVTFSSMISERKVASDVKLTIKRNGKQKDVTLKLGRLNLSDLKTGGGG